MMAAPINVDQIIENIYENYEKNGLSDMIDTDKVIFQNESGKCKYIDTYEHFEVFNNRLLQNGLIPHKWSVRGNYIRPKIRPFLKSAEFEKIKHILDSSSFLGKAEHETSEDYVYYPTLTASFLGWRLFLKLNGTELDDYIPLMGNETLGNTNLFVLEYKDFIDVKMIIRMCDNEMAYSAAHLYSNHTFSQQNSYTQLFTFERGDYKVVCDICADLVSTVRDVFDYIRDDTNLKSAETHQSFKDVVHIDLMKYEPEKMRPKKVIGTISSRKRDKILESIKKAVKTVSDSMIEILSVYNITSDVMQDYFYKSDFVNFEYLMIYVWQRVESQVFYMKTYFRSTYEPPTDLYLTLLCDHLFEGNSEKLRLARREVEPYFDVKGNVFVDLCRELNFFSQTNELGTYFAIHYAIYLTKGTWEYNVENIRDLEFSNSLSIKSRGYFKKIEYHNDHYIFDGHCYRHVKNKVLSEFSVLSESHWFGKFNDCNFLFPSEDGVFNVIKFKYHDHCPFMVSNCLVMPLVRRKEKYNFAPKQIIDYMINNIKEEVLLFRTYHCSKFVRDMRCHQLNIKLLRCVNAGKNLEYEKYMEDEKSNLKDGKSNLDDEKCNLENEKSNLEDEKSKLMRLFKEIWNLTDEELVGIAMFLNKAEVMKLYNKKTKKINRTAFIVALVINLCTPSKYLDDLDLIWGCLYDEKNYFFDISNFSHSEFVQYHMLDLYDKRHDIISALHDQITRTDWIIDVILDFSHFHQFIKKAIKEHSNSKIKVTEEDNDNDSDLMTNYAAHVDLANNTIECWPVWQDKLIVHRQNEDYNAWLVRFYNRTLLSKIDTSNVRPDVLRKVIKGYLYFRVLANFNIHNSLILMHFSASLAMPKNLEKGCVILTGISGSGKSNFINNLEALVTSFRCDKTKHKVKSEKADEEARRYMAQLFILEELTETSRDFMEPDIKWPWTIEHGCVDPNLRNYLIKRNSPVHLVNSNFKMVITNKSLLKVSDYNDDKENRIIQIYLNHSFGESSDFVFSGSVYDNITKKRYPKIHKANNYQTEPIRVFLLHILKYNRNSADGFIHYKTFTENSDSNHNQMCLQIYNDPMAALKYVLRVKKKEGHKMDSSNLLKSIQLAIPYVNELCCRYLKNKDKESILCKFLNEYQEYTEQNNQLNGIYVAENKSEFNTDKPSLLC